MIVFILEKKGDILKTVIETYIEEQPEDVQIILKNIRAMILKEFPEVEERFSWNMPQIYYKGNVVWFANFKAHIGVYPEPEAIVEFAERLSGYKTTKGAIQFKKKDEMATLQIKQFRKISKLQYA